MYTTGIIQSSQAFYYVHETRQVVCTRLTPFSPCSPCSPCSPWSTYLEPSLLWQDPSTSSPGCSWTDSLFPHLAHVAPNPKSRPPWGLPDPNIHLIRTTLRTQPKCSLTGTQGVLGALAVIMCWEEERELGWRAGKEGWQSLWAGTERGDWGGPFSS